MFMKIIHLYKKKKKMAINNQKAILKEKLISKHESNLMTFKVKLKIMKNLLLYIIIIYTKF